MNNLVQFLLSAYIICLKYIKISSQNLGNGREDKNGRR